MTRPSPINPGHEGVRALLRVVGPVVALAGLALIVVGVADFFQAFGSFGAGTSFPSGAPQGPDRFWMAFVGMPLLFVGLVLSQFAYMGVIGRYVAAEHAPVAADTANYLAGATQPGVRTAGRAFGTGFREGMAGSPACGHCGALSPQGARHCGQCGKLLAGPCPGCGAAGVPGTRFCLACGRATA
jgi:hypothetical protein